MSFRRYVAYIVLILIFVNLLLVARKLFLAHQFIDEQTAIEKAEFYCEQLNSPPQETPHNISAKLLTCSKAGEHTPRNFCEEASTVWVVSMDGLWSHEGPPNADGSKSIPLPLHTCKIFMDAETADMIEMQSK